MAQHEHDDEHEQNGTQPAGGLRAVGGSRADTDAVEHSGDEAATGRRGRGRRPRKRGAEPPTGVDRAAAADPESDPEDVARGIVLRQLTASPRSRQQLFETLMRRGCDPEVADRVLDRMTQVGLVDDAAYARSLVRSQQASRGLARRALRQELRKKGVEQDEADQALSEVDDEDELERARELAAKKMRSMHGLEPAVQTRRLAGMLARKGYPSSVAWQVVRETVTDAPEHQRD